MFQQITKATTTRKLHYIPGGDGLAAIYVENGQKDTMYYIHKDHLGSFDVVTGESGNVVERMSFDPWGRRRNPTNWTYSGVSTSYTFERGFTGHEHLDEFNLVNMNGRVYDAVLGRFLSPDKIVQFPGFTQSYNRYSYVFNNPLRFIDPSGWEVPEDEVSKYNNAKKNDEDGGGTIEFSSSLWLIINILWNSPHGGTWTPSKGFHYYSSRTDAIRTTLNSPNPFPITGSGSGIIQTLYENLGRNNEIVDIQMDRTGNLSVSFLEDGYGFNIVFSKLFVESYDDINENNQGSPTKGFNFPGHFAKLGDIADDALLNAVAFSLRDYAKSGTALKYGKTINGKIRSANVLTRASKINAYKYANIAKTSGRYLGYAGVAITAIDGLSDGNFTWGDAAKVGIGLATILTPYGWVYGIADLGTLAISGTSITDRIGSYIDD